MPTPVVVVHDDRTTRELAAGALRAAGYEVTAFYSPMQVLDAMDTPTRIQVLVTQVDFGPGRLNGAALARMVRSKQPTAQVVFVAVEKNRPHTIELGEFLPVPLDPDLLVGVVDTLLLEISEA